MVVIVVVDVILIGHAAKIGAIFGCCRGLEQDVFGLIRFGIPKSGLF
jgi:hypothetical protein